MYAEIIFPNKESWAHLIPPRQPCLWLKTLTFLGGGCLFAGYVCTLYNRVATRVRGSSKSPRENKNNKYGAIYHYQLLLYFFWSCVSGPSIFPLTDLFVFNSVLYLDIQESFNVDKDTPMFSLMFVAPI